MHYIDFKLQRAIWLSLFKKDADAKRINDIIDIFEKYYKKLKLISKIFVFDSKLKEEVEASKAAFCEKVIPIAQEYFEKEDYTNAFNFYMRIFHVDSENETNVKNCLECAKKLDINDIEIEMAKKLAKKDPENLKILASAYKKDKNFDEAIKVYKQYMEKSPTVRGAGEYTTLGCLYWDRFHIPNRIASDAKELYRCFMKALELEPESKLYIKNAISACCVTEHWEEELELWKRYRTKEKLTDDDKFSIGALCFRLCQFEESAKYINARFTKPNGSIYPKMKAPEWTGEEDLADKTILVHYEQGFGDTILYYNFVKQLTKKAKKVIFVVQPKLYSLIKENDPEIKVYPGGTDLKKLKYDYHIPTMSLHTALKLDKKTLPTEIGFIKTKEEDREKFKKEYFKNDKLKIGIAFKGNASGNQRRDIPIEKVALLDKLNNVEFYCLSVDVKDDDLKVFKRNKVYNIAKDFVDFKATAIAMDCMDVIVSMDNCILNLAGALGKKTFGMFNKRFEFRWYDLTGEDCGWYKTVKPFINSEFDEWEPSFKKVIKEIKSMKK